MHSLIDTAYERGGVRNVENDCPFSLAMAAIIIKINRNSTEKPSLLMMRQWSVRQ